MPVAGVNSDHRLGWAVPPHASQRMDLGSVCMQATAHAGLCSGLVGFFLVLKMEPQIPMDSVSIVTPSPKVVP